MVQLLSTHLSTMITSDFLHSMFFFVPSADCSGGVCEHVFNIPTSNVPPSYTVTVFASNLVGGGPRYTSQPIGEPKVEFSSSNITCESLD